MQKREDELVCRDKTSKNILNCRSLTLRRSQTRAFLPSSRFYWVAATSRAKGYPRKNLRVLDHLSPVTARSLYYEYHSVLRPGFSENAPLTYFRDVRHFWHNIILFLFKNLWQFLDKKKRNSLSSTWKLLKMWQAHYSPVACLEIFARASHWSFGNTAVGGIACRCENQFKARKDLAQW